MKVLYFNKETSKRRISKDNKGFHCYLKEGKKKKISFSGFRHLQIGEFFYFADLQPVSIS